MNRPIYTEFKGDNRESFEWHLLNYLDLLNEYCSFLERRNKTLDGSDKFLRDMTYELDKALDKACERIANISKCGNCEYCYVHKMGSGCDAEDWKEWALSDE